MDPATKLRIARRLAAISLGIEEAEIPEDAQIEMAETTDGVIHIRGLFTCKGSIESISVPVVITGVAAEDIEPGDAVALSPEVFRKAR